MHVILRIIGWLVIVGGTLTSVGGFYIDHMNVDEPEDDPDPEGDRVRPKPSHAH